VRAGFFLLDNSEHKMPLRSIFRRGIEMVLEDIVWLEVKRNVIGYHILMPRQNRIFVYGKGKSILFTLLWLKRQMHPVAQYGFNVIRIGDLEKSKVQIEIINKLLYIIIPQYHPNICETDIVCHVGNSASDARC